MRDIGGFGRSGLLVLAAWVAVPNPAKAQQIDLSGEWSTIYHEDSPHRGAGPDLGDYSGLPINEAGRLKAESWDASSLSLRERQCIPHISSYALRGPGTIRLWKANDPIGGQLTAYHMTIDAARGGTVRGVIDALNTIIEIAVPRDWQEGGTMIVPGHGRLADEADVVEYRDMVTIVYAHHGPGTGGDDARAGEGCQADARLRRAIRRGQWSVDDGDVHRGGVSGC